MAMLNGNDHLAQLLIGLQVSMGIDDTLEREHLGDLWVKRTRFWRWDLDDFQNLGSACLIEYDLTSDVLSLFQGLMNGKVRDICRVLRPKDDKRHRRALAAFIAPAMPG